MRLVYSPTKQNLFGKKKNPRGYLLFDSEEIAVLGKYVCGVGGRIINRKTQFVSLLHFSAFIRFLLKKVMHIHGREEDSPKEKGM